MHTRLKLALGVGAGAAAAVAVTAAFAGGGPAVKGNLNGYEEVPAVSTEGHGAFRATLAPADEGLSYRLSYSDLEGDVTQAHIHFGQPDVNGGISVFLCSNLGNGPAGTQPCPPPPAVVTGTISAADVIGPAPQGIATGELGELLRAIKAGNAYANVHSTKFPGGEIRSQLKGSANPDR